MNKTTLLVPFLLLGAVAAQGQNPIIGGQFSADPTARVFDGRLYLYPSHDIHPSANPNQKQDWFCMADYHCFSSANLTEWTDHGRILDQTEVPWGNPTAFSMWAPDCVKGKDGRFYFFFPDAPAGPGRGFGVGVAVSDTPYGPFVAEPKQLEGVMGIDPCVLQTSKGESYLFWGGGNIRVAKMNDNLLALADEELQNPTEVPFRMPGAPAANDKKSGKKGKKDAPAEAPRMMKFYGHNIEGLPEGFKEGPFAFERNGKFYLTFPWVRGKKEKPTDNPTETLAYAMSDNPMGPYEFKGIIMAESATGCWTNHHSIVEYQGQWYLFYHHNDYSPRFDKNRSVCCDSLFFNADGTIQEVKPTRRGVGVTDGRGQVQMDRYSTIGGGARIDYIDTTNCFLGWKTILPAGGFVTYSNVRVPEGDYKVWVSTVGWFGRGQVQTIDKTPLKLEVLPQKNGLATLKLSNPAGQPQEVDWVSLNSRRPLQPATRGGLETGGYRNLFVEAGYPAEEVEKKLQEVFNDVFRSKNKCYFEVGNDMAYISDIKNKDVRTEGMSYGMMIAVQFGEKDIFDRLWRWSKKYMQMEEGPMKGYFRWSCKTDGTANAQGPASDGELYFITSLIFASNRWGNDGEINYLKEAQYILDQVQPREVEQEVRWGENGPLETPRKVKRTISLIDPETKLITFVPGANYTDPSYHLPAFYEVWARYAEDGRASYWRECARKSREYLHRSIHPLTGLNPDCNKYDGSSLFDPKKNANNRHPWAGMNTAFRYDSWRVPMNIALDYSWSCADRVWQQNYAHKIQNFLYSEGLTTFVDQYNVDGTKPERLYRAGDFPEKLRHSVGFVATAAAASICCSHPISYEFIDHLWTMPHQPEPDGFFDAYYDGLLRLFAFMHLSGHYRVIERTPQLPTYLKPVEGAYAQTDEEGFVRRWLIHDPIDKPNRSNTVFVDSYLRETFPAPIVWKKKDKAWHGFDSQLYNVKLYRYSTCTGQQKYGVIYWVTTVIECDEELKDVRLAIGSNSASMWWVDGQEAAILSGDRRMVRDDAVSRRLTLHKGKNVVTGAIINGPGMSDFCVRLIDDQFQPIKNVKICLPL
jgi:endo-1,4-beta-D-glucanase Y